MPASVSRISPPADHQVANPAWPPSPYEESDSSDDHPHPIMLKRTLDDISTLTNELGPSHLIVAEGWNSLGLIRLHIQHDIHAALKCHRQALSIFLDNQQASTMDTALTWIDLGRCYERLDECACALHAYEEAQRLVLNDTSVRRAHCVVESLNRTIARMHRS